VDSLNIIRMIVSPGTAHSSGIDMVRHNVAIVCEFAFAKRTLATLRSYLSVEQFTHFSIGAEFPVSSGVMWILDPADTQLLGR